jgi:hypothetical protein
LKLGYGADQVLDRLDIQVIGQVLGPQEAQFFLGFQNNFEANMVSFPMPTHTHFYSNHSNGYVHLNTANVWSSVDR